MFVLRPGKCYSIDKDFFIKTGDDVMGKKDDSKKDKDKKKGDKKDKKDKDKKKKKK